MLDEPSEPPRNGEGDRREAVVEGSRLNPLTRNAGLSRHPSVSASRCHLPVPGRSW
jgi:hypothetical protein